MTTADLLIITLSCGCTKDTDCAHAAHMRQRPELSRQLMEHRRAVNRSYAAALAVVERREGTA